ncbi:MAG TPA: hypothetical protein VD886_18965 [Herpetosiphonaceae bacterium]|nr:hypothetical protein [Herpetosiphonaceae bacterium]
MLCPDHHPSSDLAAHLDALRAEVHAQKREIAALRTELSAVRAQPSPFQQQSPIRLRPLVWFVCLAGVLAFSLAHMPATRAQSPQDLPARHTASPNASGTGEALQIGMPNQPDEVSDTTRLFNPSGTQLMGKTLVVQNYTTGLGFVPTVLPSAYHVAIVGSTNGDMGSDTKTNRIGVAGLSDSGQGVFAYSRDYQGIAGSGGQYGGVFEGGRAALWLRPSATSGPPRSGSHQLGELSVSADGHLWFCRASGTPGTWVRLDLTSAFIPLVQK